MNTKDILYKRKDRKQFNSLCAIVERYLPKGDDLIQQCLDKLKQISMNIELKQATLEKLQHYGNENEFLATFLDGFSLKLHRLLQHIHSQHMI